MQDISAQQKKMPCDFGPKITEKGWCKSEDQGRFDRIILEGQMGSLHAN